MHFPSNMWAHELPSLQSAVWGTCPLQGQDCNAASRTAATTEWNSKDFQFLPNILFRHFLAKTLDQEPSAPVFQQSVGVEGYTLAGSINLSTFTVNLKQSAVPGTRTSLLPCILVVLSPPVCSLSHLKILLTLTIPVTRRGVLFAFSPGAVSCFMR